MSNKEEKHTRQYVRWTDEEDHILRQFAEQHTNQNDIKWVELENRICTKTARQCFDRYIYLKKRSLCAEKHFWTIEETERFQEAV